MGGLPVRLPQVDMHTVGAGGGSIAWIDEGGALRVGPAQRRGRPRAGLLRAGRDAAHRHRRQSAAGPARPPRCRWPAACGSTAAAARRAVASGRGGVPRPARRRPRDRRGGKPGDGGAPSGWSPSSAGTTPRAGAGGVRRRRAAARLRGGRRAGHPPGARPGGRAACCRRWGSRPATAAGTRCAAWLRPLAGMTAATSCAGWCRGRPASAAAPRGGLRPALPRARRSS